MNASATLAAMTLAPLRLLRVLATELALLALGLGAGALLLGDGEPGWAAAMAAAGLGASILGGVRLWRGGWLQLVWRCPLLWRAGLQVATRDLPWPQLDAAEATLRVLAHEGAGLRAFFCGADRDLVASSQRALEAHQRLRRAEQAIAGAPPGPGREVLEGQRRDASSALSTLLALTGEVRTQCLAATAPHARFEEALPSLRALGQRAEALEEARAALHAHDTLPRRVRP